MYFDPPLQPAVLLKRYKRFLADVELPDGSLLTVHCPNTGSMLGCDQPGSPVWLSQSANPKRKYPHTWELIETDPGVLVGVNTSRANQLVAEALHEGVVAELGGFQTIKPETRSEDGQSRMDFLLLDSQEQRCYVEVKSVTLDGGNGLALFPDAVTERGRKHIHSLMDCVQRGHRAVLLFCVQRTDARKVSLAGHIDAVYADSLRRALVQGVEVLAYQARLGPREVVLVRRLPFMLEQ
jgi:sugar fermentation stimulation protein A